MVVFDDTGLIISLIPFLHILIIKNNKNFKARGYFIKMFLLSFFEEDNFKLKSEDQKIQNNMCQNYNLSIFQTFSFRVLLFVKFPKYFVQHYLTINSLYSPYVLTKNIIQASSILNFVFKYRFEIKSIIQNILSTQMILTIITIILRLCYHLAGGSLVKMGIIIAVSVTLPIFFFQIPIFKIILCITAAIILQIIIRAFFNNSNTKSSSNQSLISVTKLPSQYMSLQIQQSQFIDLSSRMKKIKSKQQRNQQLNKEYNPLDYLPNPNDYTEDDSKLQYKKYKYEKYDETKLNMGNENDNKRLNNMIRLYYHGLNLHLDVVQNKELKKQVKKHSNLLLNLYKHNQKAYLILLHATKVGWIKDIQYLYLLNNIRSYNRSRYPLLTLQEAKNAYLNKSFINNKLYVKLFEQCIKYGQKAAFFFYGSCCRKQGDHLKAYQIYKNGADLGFIPCLIGLGKLFTLGGKKLPKNTQIAVFYYEKAMEQTEISIDQQDLLYYEIMKKQLKENQKRAKNITTTKDFQAQIVSDFISCKLNESQNKNLQDCLSYGITNNITPQQTFSFIKKAKIFYVVFSPLMSYPSRGFLAEDENGTIESIYVYGWEQIPPKTLELLHKLGTKVILKQYIKKQSTYSKLPIIRVQNSSWIQIIPNTEKHQIKDEKIIEFGKILMKKDLYSKAVPLYTYLVAKNGSKLEIAYSDLGFAYQKLSNIDNALRFYRKSIEIKDNSQSKQRLFELYLSLQNFQQCERVIEIVKEEKIKQQMMYFLQKNRKAKQDRLDFNLNSFKKQRKKISPRLLYQGFDIKTGQDYLQKFSNPLNPSGRSNFNIYKQLFLKNKDLIKVIDKKTRQNQKKFILKIQQIYELPECKNIKDISPKQINQFFEFWNDIFFIRKKHPYSIQANQLFNYLECKKHHIEKRLINFCRNLEQNQQQKMALEYYMAGNYMPDIFSIRAIQLLVQTKNLEMALNYCCYRFEQMLKMQQCPLVSDYIQSYHLQMVNIMIKLKIYQKVYQSAGRFLKSERNSMQRLIPIKLFSWQKKQRYKQYCKKHNRLKVLHAIGCLHMNKFDEAMLIIQTALGQKQQGYLDVEVYYQLMMLKAKILKYQQNNIQGLKQIQLALRSVEKQKKQEFENKEIFQKAFKMEKINLLIKLNRIKQTIGFCQQIVKLSAKNLIFVQKKLFRIAYLHPNFADQLIQLIKNSSVLNCLSNNLFIQLSAYLDQDQMLKKQKNKNKEQQIREKQNYFNIQKFGQQNILMPPTSEQINQNELQSENKQDYGRYIYEYHLDRISQGISSQHNLKLEKKNTSTQDFQLIQHFQCQQALWQQGYICTITNPKNHQKNIIVIFDPKMKLQAQEQCKFILAACKICKKNFGSNGIKHMEDGSLRLKIHGTGRLVGKVMHKAERIFYVFYRREGHDDYKRK